MDRRRGNSTWTNQSVRQIKNVKKKVHLFPFVLGHELVMRIGIHAENPEKTCQLAVLR